jgi:hypothetical protein
MVRDNTVMSFSDIGSCNAKFINGILRYIWVVWLQVLLQV